MTLSFIFQSTPPGWEATIRGKFAMSSPNQFQSTPPGWEATYLLECCAQSQYISIHASRVGGDEAVAPINTMLTISIHASRVGGDVDRKLPLILRIISIHASRVGGDTICYIICRASKNFNPRLPGGRRLYAYIEAVYHLLFQSTPPGWEATILFMLPTKTTKAFQSTPPGWEATSA